MVIFRRNYRQEMLQKGDYSDNKSPKLKHFFYASLLASSSLALLLYIIDIDFVTHYFSTLAAPLDAASTPSELADSNNG